MYTFGVSREHFKKVYIPEAKITPDESNPGPGAYDMKYMTLGSSGKKWNMQGRSIVVNGKWYFS
jgi:hypothetical protein